jgi:hypothetical protein
MTGRSLLRAFFSQRFPRNAMPKPKPKPSTSTKKSSANRGPTPLPINPFAPQPEFPQWFKNQFPDYVTAAGHHHGPTRSVRTASHGGHSVKVTTTYEVEIDGQPFALHMMVDNEGNLWSHTCPYHTFPSAIELIQFLIDQLPEAFSAGAGRGGHNGHDGHEHGEHGHGGHHH